MIPLLHRAQEKDPPPGIGVEVDVWWSSANGAPCIGHDPPTCAFPVPWTGESPQLPFGFVGWLNADVARCGFRPLYAVNCKSDGLEVPVRDAFDRFGVPRDRWFAFDASYPSQRVFEKTGLPFAERVSEEEPWRARSHLIWLDRWTWRDNGAAFLGPALAPRRFPVPLGDGIYLPDLHRGRRVEVHAVSMELHVPDAADHERKAWWLWLFEHVRPASVCTDHPEELMAAWKEWKR